MCSTLRSVTDDVTIGDYMFPAGAFIIVNTYAANRDPSIYEDPKCVSTSLVPIRRPSSPSAVVRAIAWGPTVPGENCPKRSRSFPNACRIRGAPKTHRGGHFSA